MGFRGWLTKNATKVIENTVEQSKQTLATNVGNKTDLYYKLGRIGLLLVLAWLTGKETSGYLQEERAPKALPSPSTMIVNNYIYGHENKERRTEE